MGKESLRWQVLACMPDNRPWLHDLRRRMATAFFFSDAASATQDPSQYVDLGVVLRRLQCDDFVVGPRTDHYELAAKIRFLDVVVDDGGRGSFRGADAAATAAEARDAFNDDVDAVAGHLLAVWRTIEASSGAPISRLDSKTIVDDIQKRLLRSVRTRPPPKAGDVFGGAARPRNGIDYKQQERIDKFFPRRKPKEG